MTNGPLYVAFTVYSDFPTYRSGVYKHTTSSQLGGHAVLAVGGAPSTARPTGRSRIPGMSNGVPTVTSSSAVATTNVALSPV
jgi:hypothetical protein